MRVARIGFVAAMLLGACGVANATSYILNGTGNTPGTAQPLVYLDDVTVNSSPAVPAGSPRTDDWYFSITQPLYIKYGQVSFSNVSDFRVELFDPTNLTTPGGRAFLRKLGGTAAGNEIADDYVKVLAATGVTGYPYVQAAAHPSPGSEEAPTGVRVDNQKLLDMNAYLNSLPAPPGVVASADAVTRGRTLFRTGTCVNCHNVDQGKPVPAFIAAMKDVFPGDNPVVLLAQRDPPLNPILNTVASIFDDKMAVVNASLRGEIRGLAMPLLLDLARKPNFLHDNSVPNLDALLDPSRGTTAPHPFYLADAAQRADMGDFLRSLDTGP